MAQYKVPQDVEADDKLLGPFTFRQFIYLLVAAGFIALAWALFNIFPGLVLIPLPVIFFFGALALPLKKDQPMETYLAAIVSFYLKPRTRIWEAGQSESTIQIIAPKKTEENRTKNLSSDEATHRLSFLAEIVDSGGYSIKGAIASPLKEEFYAEANTAEDMFDDTSTATNIEQVIQSKDTARHQEIVHQMRTAIEKAENIRNTEIPQITKFETPEQQAPILPTPAISPNVVNPTTVPQNAPQPPQTIPQPPQSSVIINPTEAPPENTPQKQPNLTNLANNPDLSVETIAKEAKRLETKNDDEVYISLH